MARIPDVRFSRVSRNGSSRGVNLPRVLLEQLHWQEGTTLELWIDGDSLVLSPAVSRRALLDRAADVERAVHNPAGKAGKR